MPKMVNQLLIKMFDQTQHHPSTQLSPPPINPLIVITGSTGTGKSKLAIELAKQFPSEIISADSMQVYKGLDIVSNKITQEEMEGVVHHMIDVADPFQLLTVTDYQRKTLTIIDQIRQKGKVPILVGGTFYYIESILYDSLVDSSPTDSNDQESLLYEQELKHLHKVIYDEKTLKIDNFFQQPIIPFNLVNVPSQTLHQILNEIDPQSAKTLHPNNKRKIIRCLQVFQQSGRKYSEFVAQQKQRQGGSYLGGPLRFANSLLLNIDVDKSTLDQRLDARVDQMIERGLIEELLQFHRLHNRRRMEECGHLDYVHGMFQTIGFKEFHQFLILDQERRTAEEGKRLFNLGLEDMKRVTRKYANKQTKWLGNRFLRQGREIPFIYSLDGTNLNEWNQQVLQPATEIVECFLKGQPVRPEWEESRRMRPKEIAYDVPDTFHCDTCDRVIVGRETWKIHLKSKKHRRVGRQQQQEEENEVMIEKQSHIKRRKIAFVIKKSQDQGNDFNSDIVNTNQC